MSSSAQDILTHQALSNAFRGRMRGWGHSGFSTRNEATVVAEDAEGREKRAGQMLRAPMSVKTMTYDAAGF